MPFDTSHRLLQLQLSSGLGVEDKRSV